MSFLNPALAFGALAFLIPLVIHILNRSRFKKVDWGAMHLLESVIKINHKRFRLDQLILLLVRCLIPALLAFCIARPLLTSSKTMDSDTPVSLLILLDASYSMDTMEQGGTRWNQALNATRKLVESTSKGSDVHVLIMGSRSIPLFDQPIFDKEAIVRRLENYQGGFGSGDVRKGIQDGLQVLESMSNAHRELVIISDFQEKDWQELISDGASNIKSLLKSSRLEPRLTLIPFGKINSENVAIESIDHPTKAIGAGEPHAYRIGIRNFGQQPVKNARVVFRVDGKEESVSQVSLGPDSSAQTLFTHTFKKPGSHLVEAEIVTDDALKTDNQFAVSMTAWDRLKVLLVDGDPNPNPLKSETDFLQVALTPYTLGRSQLSDLVETQTVTTSRMDQSMLEVSKVVVLANVSRLSKEQTESLTEFVAQGGVLFVFPGDQIDLKWYREEMHASGNGILPAPFGQRKSNEFRPVRIVAQRFDHPSLDYFNEPDNGDLSQADIQSYYLLDKKAISNASEAQTAVMARLDNADPFLMEKAYGKGIVIQMASTCDADWNDLPMKPAFLPLIQQLITTTASRLIPDRNLSPGEPAVALYSAETGIQSVPVRTPSGAERLIETEDVGGMLSASYTATIRPGVYSFTTGEATIRFSVQANRNESDAKLLDKAKLNDLGKRLDGNVVGSAAEYLSQDNLRRNGSEIWKYLLMGFLAFLFLEIVLQQRFSRVRV